MTIPPPTPTLFPYTTLFRSLSARPPAIDGLLRCGLVRCGSNSLLHRLGHLLVGLAKQESVVRESRLLLPQRDRKSTRLNSSHVKISYAVFCLKKEKQAQGVD